MEIKLNIGFNVANSKPLDIFRVLELISTTKGIVISDFQLVEGTYLDQREQTLYVKAEFSGNLSKLVSNIEDFAIQLKQDCIALITPMGGILVYNPNFKGEYLSFDYKYFKTN